MDSDLGVSEIRGMLVLRRAELEQALEADLARLSSVEARLQTIESEGVMSEFEVIIKAVPAVRLAVLRAEVDGFEPKYITPVISPLYDKLYASLGAAGITPVGPGLAFYEELDGGKVRVNAGAAISSAVVDGPFDIVELPALEQVATLIHHGPMDYVMPAVQAIARWVDAHGWVAQGLDRELYLDYGMGDDPSKWTTELQQPVRKA